MVRSIFVALLCILLALPSLGHLFGPGDAGVGDEAVLPDDSMAAPEAPRDLGRLLGGMSGGFVENRGQVANADVRYYAQGDTITVGLTPTGVVMTVREASQPSVTDRSSDEIPARMATTFGIDFVGCVPVEPQGRGAPGHLSNYFLGNDPDRWVRGAPSFPEVLYQGLWPGIDLRFHFRDGALKYEFILDAGADSDSINLQYRGVAGLDVDRATGELVVTLPVGELRDARPVILQGGILPPEGTAGDFEVMDDSIVRFVLPAACDPARSLIIDPGLEFSTLYGGRGTEETEDADLDQDGNMYLMAKTYSDDLQTTPGAFNTTLQGVADIAVVKFDPTLSTLLFATYIGGFSENDEGMMLRVVDGKGVYICGYTESNDFPTTPGVVAPTALGGRDAFLLELSLDGSAILKCTYVGGSALDNSKSMDFDGDGNIYVAGRTVSPNFPTTPGAYDRTWGGGNRGDAFVLKLNEAMDTVLYGTYLGGPREEFWVAIKLDKEGNMYVIGQTQSLYFPVTSGAFCTTYCGGDYDGFISKLSANGSELLSSTFLAGNNTDYPNDILFMDNGSVLILSSTYSPDFPTTADAMRRTLSGQDDMILTMMDANLSELQYSSYFGGNGYDHLYEMGWGQGKEILYSIGYTNSTDLPTTVGCYDPILRGFTGMVIISIRMDPPRISYCTYLGGMSTDMIRYGGLAVSDDDHLVVGGFTYSADFPTTSMAYDSVKNGTTGSDAFVLWFDPTPCGVPDPPTGLVATAGNGYVKLSWAVPFNESYRMLGQRLYRGTSPDDVSEPVELGLQGAFNDTKVTNGVTYYYQVVTINSAGESARPPAVNATPLGPPSEPLELIATTGNGTIQLEWQRPTALGGRLGGYHVLRGLSAEALEHLATIGPTESYMDAEVVMGTTYNYAVMAYNALFNGTASKVVRIKALGLPSAPTDLAAVSGNHSLSLSWSAPVEDGGSSLLAYYIYTSPDGDAWAFLATVLPTTPAFKHLGLENGIAQHYRVTAMSIVGEGPASEPVSAIPVGDPSVPLAVAATGHDGQVRLTWEAPRFDGGVPITGYRIYGGSLVDALALLHTSPALARDFTHAPVPNGETRYYAVSALNAFGEGGRSAIVQATTMGPPSAPRDFATTVTPAGILLTWGVPDDDGGSPVLVYRVMRGSSPSALALLASVDGALSYLDASAEKAMTYFYQVVPVNARGEAGAPSEVRSQVMLDLPGVPVDLRATAGNRTVSLAWGTPATDGGSPITLFIVFRGTTGTEPVEIARVQVRLYEDRDPSLENGVTYLYAVSAVNGVGPGPQSAPVQARPLPPPGKGLLAAKEVEGTVQLTWTPPSGEAAAVTGYVVLRGRSEGTMSIVAELGAVTSYTDSLAEAGATYYYSVYARSGSGDGERADAVSVKLPEEVGEPSWMLLALVGMLVVIALLAGALMMRGRGGAKGGTE